jgi:prepilin-type N-terminal cleavage/methylation domain-containing protein
MPPTKSKKTTREMSAARRRSQGGFTLIEILVVVTLLTMLAVIAIPNYLDARKESAKSACISNIKEISNATEQWALEMRKDPNSAVTFDDIQPYLKGSIVCPAGGKTFDDSYTISVVANEPTCRRDPQDHYWLGSTTVAALQNNKAPTATTTTTIVNGLIGETSGDSSGNGKGGSQNGGSKGKGGKGK